MSQREFHLEHGDRVLDLAITGHEGEVIIHLGDGDRHVRVLHASDHELALASGHDLIVGSYRFVNGGFEVKWGGRTWPFRKRIPGGPGPDDGQDSRSEILAPMTGKVIEVLSSPGDSVEAGTPLLIVEAMKMEHRLTAPAAARVVEVAVTAGDQVDIGQLLARLDCGVDGDEHDG